ncbi:MAG TPA: patatin-like phospholipase family protein [Saprospiraceae bacterium]|nr:patatin-like phospholipase family protein [Saprospiraceae bacterium]HPQ21142.1 patatin-like phospholipase family protein [Saprospiraceae bacterium]HRX29249.1 patatin-like phospholipase family protein [Saprospiraceae bacterium]
MQLRKLLTFLLFCSVISSVYSQSVKPKVALVLSGGGAKGFVHIPVLQTLDSLGIVPDIIIGTSMGSIVGGLYAMGYSGDDIYNMASQVNWNELFSEGVSLRDVAVEEKSEYEEYLTELNINHGRFKTSNYLLNDFNLMNLFEKLTVSTYSLKNFDELNIPFRSVTTNIVTGKEFVIDKGSLAVAMRASMSIPALFDPVVLDDKILLDGGVLNNFPTDIAKKWGADIIIGSDVGEGMVSKEGLNNLSDLLFQTGMLISNLHHEESKKLCDILVNNFPNLKYSSGDFDKLNDFIDDGSIALKEVLPQLQSLSYQLKNFKQRTRHQPIPLDSLVIDEEIFTGVNPENYKYIKARIGVEIGKYNQIDAIEQGLVNAMGSTLFEKLSYNISNHESKTTLEIDAKERDKHRFKASIHYDRHNGVGLILNYTGRNITGPASRSLISIDLAEQPKIRLQNIIHVGHERNWWWKAEALALQSRESIYQKGFEADYFRYRYFNFLNEFNKNINNLQSFIGLGIKYELTHFHPIINAEINPGIYGIKKYNFHTLDLFLKYEFNSLNKVLYPNSGRYIRVKLNRNLSNHVAVSYIDNNLSEVEGKVNGYWIFQFDFQQLFRLSSHTILGASVNIGNTLIDENSQLNFESYAFGSKFFIGGITDYYRSYQLEFYGLKRNEILATQYLSTTLSLQYRYNYDYYVTPHFSIANVAYGDLSDFASQLFKSNNKWTNFDTSGISVLASAGCMFSYNSLIGPIDFDCTWVNDVDKFRWNLRVGYLFPK